MGHLNYLQRPRRSRTATTRPDAPTAALGALLKDQRIDGGQRLRDVSATTGIPIWRLSMLERGLGIIKVSEATAISAAVRKR